MAPSRGECWRWMRCVVRNLGHRVQVTAGASLPQQTEARPGALVTWGSRRGQHPGGHVSRVGLALSGRALSRMGDGFHLFNFHLAFCGMRALFEIDHPLIGRRRLRVKFMKPLPTTSLKSVP